MGTPLPGAAASAPARSGGRSAAIAPSAATFAERIDRVVSGVRHRRATALLTLVPENVAYLTGFLAAAYTRPIVLVAARDPVLIVPELELANARGVWSGEIRAYSDDGVNTEAGRTHLYVALNTAAEAARALRLSAVAYEPHGLSHEGATILCCLLHNAVRVGHIVEMLRMRKDPSELAVIRETGRLIGNAMASHVALSRSGMTEVCLQHRAVAEVAAGLAADDVDIEIWSRPIAGPRTALPHARPTTRPLQAADVIIHSLGIRALGYWTGLERTCVMGEPDDRMTRAFVTMQSAQTRAIQAVRPGVNAAHVHVVACRVIAEAGYPVLHRTGHGVGLSVHEPPSLGSEESLRLEPGMVLSIEPGVYLPGIGGFRHADNVIITESGAELLCEFPREMTGLLLPTDRDVEGSEGDGQSD